MQKDGYLLLVDTVAKMHRYLRVTGWFHHDSDILTGIAFAGPEPLAVKSETGFDHGGVIHDLGPGKGFRLEVFMADEDFPDDACAVFTTRDGFRLERRLHDLVKDRESRLSAAAAFRHFREQVASLPGARLLELGGRDRSKVGLRNDFGNAEVTVIDVLDGPGVDVVGDAHRMGTLLPANHFDFVHSRSVFEHLLMPWKVALEMNRVMKPGGIAFITTHQTLGLHDQPWDFWRFSKDAWPALFNAYTGFEILDSFEEREQYIIPWLYTDRKKRAEWSVGFEASGVLARKTGVPRVHWPVPLDRIVDTAYPDVDDGN